MKKQILHTFLLIFCIHNLYSLPLFYWKKNSTTLNFGDELSKIIVEKIVNDKVPITHLKTTRPKLLSIGSILHFANNGDYVWGSGVNGKINSSEHKFKHLNVYAVRGPLTKKFLEKKGVQCPSIFGDPAIFLPDFFPDLKPTHKRDFIVIPNLNEIAAYKNFPNLVLPTDEPMAVVKKILEAKFVISGSLHGIIVAEAFGIPAKVLRITNKESLFKYTDYYLGSGRKGFIPAKSVEEALKMGGEPSPNYNKPKLINSFPKHLFM
jgi:pyruvyltransferase